MGSLLEKNSKAVRKRIEGHTFSDEEGEEYEGASSGFGDYFRRKKIKLQNLDAELRASSGDKPQIFKGLVVHVSGYTQPPLHVLHKDLVQHGAGFLQYLDSKTMATHIVASSFPPKKSVDYSRYRIVKPAWVTDSIAAGKLMPWSDYRVFDEGPRQKTIKFDGGKMFTQATPQSQMRYREQTQNSFYTSQLRGAVAGRSGMSSGFTSPAEAITPQSKPREDAQSSVLSDGKFSDAEKPAMDVEDHGLDDGIPDDALVEKVPDLTTETAELLEEPMVEPEPAISVTEDADPGPQSPEESPLKRAARKSGHADQKEMTSEEHNAWLLSDPHIRKASSANPEFLKQFYSESRLHHLSTWKAELKSRMQKMANERGPATKTVKPKPGTRRYIMHVDFDSFFCAVSLKKSPELADKPAVVAHGTGSGSEIASCNYPARKFGVKNGMWMKKAMELCPELKILAYDFPAYEEASGLFYESILDVGGVVQSVSVDEALVDVTTVVLKAAGSDGFGLSEGSIWREQEKANEMATGLRDKIRQKTGCEVSVGIGGNVLLAKVALRRAKPAGQFQMVSEEVMDILGGLKVEDLPGVAWSISGKLEEIGVKLVKDIRQTSKERLISTLGPKTGEKLWEYSRGIDKTEVGGQPARKSVSVEVSWGIRFINQQEAEEFIYNLCKELERRLLNEAVKGRHMTMKIMRRCLDAPLDPVKHLGHGKCDTFNKSVVFGVATHGAEVIAREAVAILRSFKFSPGDLRGLGVQLTKLEPIKAMAAGAQASQKKLTFSAGGRTSTSSGKNRETEVIEDDGSPTTKSKSTSGQPLSDDPIADDPLTPRKPKTHPALALAKAGDADSKAQTPLNVTGTQFVLPPNPDPAVMAELPKDIRGRLMAQARRDGPPGSRDTSPSAPSRSQSPALSEGIPADIDPDVFNALPDDMKAEVLASYGRQGPAGGGGGRTHPPRTPHKDRVTRTGSIKRAVTPSKRGIKGMFNRAKERAHDAEAHLVQTNFLPAAKQQQHLHPSKDTEDTKASDDDDGELEDLDPDFLAELPEDVRREVIADHRRQRLARRSGLNVDNTTLNRSQGYIDAAADGLALPGGQTRLSFPAPPPKVAFNNATLTSERQLRDMLAMWREGTRDEGPHADDVGVFERYLVRVVAEERDMAKVRNLVRWLAWDVEEQHDEAESAGKQAWRAAVETIRQAVQEAVKGRGLGPVNFD